MGNTELLGLFIHEEDPVNKSTVRFLIEVEVRSGTLG
jgi:hypothetical protein